MQCVIIDDEHPVPTPQEFYSGICMIVDQLESDTLTMDDLICLIGCAKHFMEEEFPQVG
jgi:hypothetical protein